jgi:cytochrome oxidase assembly protein ShyY1
LNSAVGDLDSSAGAKKKANWVRPTATMALNEDEDQTVPSAASGEVSRIIQVNRGDGNENAASEGMEKRLPLLTSSCPGWICFVEKTHPEAIPYLSTVKSPQQVMGSLVKSCTARSGAVANAAQEQRQETEQDVAMDISSSGVVSLGATTVEEASAKEVGSSVRTTPRVYHLTIMPCPDKKLEASRKDFEAKVDGGSADVDCVLTTNELLTWLEEEEDTDTNAATTTTTTPPSITTGKHEQYAEVWDAFDLFLFASLACALWSLNKTACCGSKHRWQGSTTHMPPSPTNKSTNTHPCISID